MQTTDVIMAIKHNPETEETTIVIVNTKTGERMEYNPQHWEVKYLSDTFNFINEKKGKVNLTFEH
jgi:hypothetical protein